MIHKAGTQDSGLFFCMSYEKQVFVFLASLAKSAGLEPDGHSAVVACNRNPIS